MVSTRSLESRLDQLEKVVEDLSTAFTNFQTEYQASRLSTDAKLDALLKKFAIPTDSTENNESGGSHIVNPEEEHSTHVQVMPSMDLPSFDGTEALSWLARAEQYFLVHETPLERRLKIAHIAMTGSTMPWIQILLRRCPTLDWSRFSRELLLQFGEGMAIYGFEALTTTRHSGTLEDYITAFEGRIAQLRMTKEANKHRRDVVFQVGDLVYLKFRPYRQRTLCAAKNRKLASRFFGPFEVEARIGAVAYRLKLPPDSRLHRVFHVSLLKKAIGTEQAEPTILLDKLAADPPFLPECVLARRSVPVPGLIKWSELGVDEATWMDLADVRGQFLYFSLEDKAVSTGGAIDSSVTDGTTNGGRRAVVKY